MEQLNLNFVWAVLLGTCSGLGTELGSMNPSGRGDPFSQKTPKMRQEEREKEKTGEEKSPAGGHRRLWLFPNFSQTGNNKEVKRGDN